MDGKIDLHIHTTASDGTYTPRRAVELARALGLAAIAVTDHDTVSGVPEAMATGEALGVEIVPGIEVSAGYDGRSVHILGLFIDPGSPALRPVLEWAVNERNARNAKIIAAMNADGFDISPEALRRANPTAVLGRPHIAGWLAEHGYVSSVEEAFDRYLDRGRPYYRPRTRMPLADAVRAIRDAGGVAVLAHPLQYGFDPDGLDRLIRDAKAAGCLAIEAYYSKYSPAQTAELLAFAARYGMAVSGGSDFHGAVKPDISMGSGIDGGLAVPHSVLDGLKAVR